MSWTAPTTTAPRSIAPRSIAPRSIAPRSIAPRSIAPDLTETEAVGTEAVGTEAVGTEMSADGTSLRVGSPGSGSKLGSLVERSNTEVGSQMCAVAQHKYGNSSVLSIENVDRPSISANEVLIEVHAAGLDRGTEHLMTGNPYLIRILGYGFVKPKNPVLGLDVSGTVVAVGADVTRFAAGDEVFGIANGSFAEFAAAKESKLAHKPVNVGFDEAAVSAVSGITALQALTDIGRVEPGQRVLVVGASGGVGTFAVQIAKARGAIVDGVAGTNNLELVRSLGATEVFDHRTTELTELEHCYDLVIDIGGRNSVHNLRRVLAKSGTLVIVGGENGNRFTGGIGRQVLASLLSPFLKQRLVMFMSKEEHSFMDRLGEYLATGQVRPVIGDRFPLADARDAMALLESGQARGKTLIEVKGACIEVKSA